MNRSTRLPRLSAVLLAACGPLADPSEEAVSSRSVAVASAVSLGTASQFAVLGASTVTCINASAVMGDLGVSPGSAITGFGSDCTVSGTVHAGDAVAAQAQDDLQAAFNGLETQACDHDLTGQDLGNQTLVPGVYCFDSSAGLTGPLTLDGAGDSDAVWIFQIGTTLTTASNSSVQVIGGGQSCNVFWQVGSSATLGTGTEFQGNILAVASVTLTSGANVAGRALALNAAVTMDDNEVSLGDCGQSGGGGGGAGGASGGAGGASGGAGGASGGAVGSGGKGGAASGGKGGKGGLGSVCPIKHQRPNHRATRKRH